MDHEQQGNDEQADIEWEPELVPVNDFNGRIEEVFTDNGYVVSGWHLIVELVDVHGKVLLRSFEPDRQPIWRTLGMVRHSGLNVEQIAVNGIGEDDDEDDW